jgi:hypothetical protein
MNRTMPHPAVPSACRRQIVVVLGMHRSGTSLLANLLTVLGVDLGEQLLGADSNNQAGYYEQTDIFQTQDALLNRLGRGWTGPAGTAPFPERWWALPSVRPFRDRLAAIVSAEVDRADGLWGFKDPRTSRLLPLWHEIFEELNLDPVYLLSIRDPAHVVESVVRRDRIPAARVERQWLLHNLDAVRDAGGRLRLVVDYDRWFTQPEEQARAILDALGLRWNGPTGDLLSGILERIRPDLRHCRAVPRPSLPFVEDAFRLLQAAAATGEVPAELTRLDADVRRALALGQPLADEIDEKTGAQSPARFSFVEHLADGTLQPLGPTAHAAVWDSVSDGVPQRDMVLHPPARISFTVPDGRRATIRFAVNLHPLAWDKPNAGGAEFLLSVDGQLQLQVSLDPVHHASDRPWREIAVDIPENPAGTHVVVFETQALGAHLDYRWAAWREPRLEWVDRGTAG